MSTLQQFYDEQAEKFSGTRKKHRPEFDIILAQIQKQIKPETKKLSVLELGCGDGRFYRFLKENLQTDFIYTGVDFAQGQINIAQKQSPDCNRVCDDMLKVLASSSQEEFDIVVSVASVQHISDKTDRNLLFKLINRTLKYNGVHISTNRTYSDIFNQKYSKEILTSRLKRFFSLGYWDKHNIYIPFKTQDKIYQRLYHIFTMEEIKSITERNGLILSDCFFVGKNGEQTTQKTSRNTLFVQKKDIFIASKEMSNQ